MMRKMLQCEKHRTISFESRLQLPKLAILPMQLIISRDCYVTGLKSHTEHPVVKSHSRLKRAFNYTWV